MAIIKAVECDKCKNLMKADGNDFFTIYGNITIGLQGGIVGGSNNIEEGKIKTNSYLCHSCFKMLTEQAIASASGQTVRGTPTTVFDDDDSRKPKQTRTSA